MRVITLNVNGITGAADKGFVRWMQRQKADIVCIQDTQAHEHQLARTVSQPRGFYGYFADSEKIGYSGVAIYSRTEPDRIVRGFGWEDLDSEGRMITADFGNLTVMSFSLPTGTHSVKKQQLKFNIMERMLPRLKELGKDGRDYIICGDWAIAHKASDLTHDKTNANSSGFTPQERAWMDTVFGEARFHDAFRVVNKEEEQFTWWSNRGQAWDKNVGWRLDYHVVSDSMVDKVVETSIYKKRRFSDHAPLTIDYAYALESGTLLEL